MLQRDMMCHRARLWKIRSWSRPKRIARQKLLTSGRHPSFCFTTNPQHPAEGVWLGWRQRVLRTSPADHIPGWLENYSRQGCAIQCYKVSHILRNSGGNHVSLRRLADLQKAVTSDLERRYIF